MTLTPLIAAADVAAKPFELTWEPLWDDLGLPLALMGITVVFLALVAITSFISNLPRLMSWIERLSPRAKPEPAVTKPVDELSEELVAVLTAAVETVLGPGHRVIRTHELTPRELAWAQQGRWQHQTSHKPR